MTDFVLDASIAMAWVLEDEESAYADDVMRSLVENDAYSPALWSLEVSNVLTIVQRRGRASWEQIEQCRDRLRALQIVEEPYSQSRVFYDVLALSKKHGLSSYDASYLELALRRRLPLASLDKALVEAAASEGVPLYQP